MFSSKYLNLFLFVFGVFIGVALSSLFNGCGDVSSSPAIINTIKPTAIQKEATKNETAFTQKLDSLKQTGKVLSKQLQSTQTLLEKAKRKNLVLQTQVYDLLDQDRTTVSNKDTAQLMADCDTLKTKVAEMIVASNEKDSLHEAVSGNLQQTVSNKDSTLALQDEKYQSLQTSFQKSLLEQKLLDVENRQLKKQTRKRKFASTLKTIGLMFLTGAAAHYIDHR